jgi:pimeloyl-ACP methyl ester carboxylesterase
MRLAPARTISGGPRTRAQYKILSRAAEALVTRLEWLLAAAGIALLAAGGWLAAQGRPAAREAIMAGDCRLPVTVLGGESAQVSAVVFHGISANRRIMNLLGRALSTPDLRVYLVDFPGHGDHTEAFDYPRTVRCSLELLQELEGRGEIAPARTVLIGHSMGAGIALRLADFFPAAATISISASLRMPPTRRPGAILRLEKPHRMPSNLLILAGGLDLPPAREMADELLAAAGGERTSADDFRERRAVQRVILPAATHTSVLFDRRVYSAAANWIRHAFPGTESPAAPSLRPLLGGLAGIAGLLALFPAAAAVVTAILRGATSPRAEKPQSPARAWPLFAWWAAAGLLAVALQARGVLLDGVVRSYNGDYLASMALFAGVLLLAAMWATERRKQEGRPHRSAPTLDWLRDVRGIAAGAVLGVLTMLGFGLWLDWQFTDAWPNAPRWLAFAAMLPCFLIYMLAEEAALGPPPQHAEGRRNAALKRLALLFGLRTVLMLAIIAGIFVLDSGEVLPMLLGLYLALFSLLQRIGADSVRRRMASPAGAAIFSAILAAWFVAAVFPLA